MEIAPVEQVAATLDAVDAELDGGGAVYLHCWGGVGRTGTIVGCWLQRHALTEGDAIRRIAELRAGVPDAWMASPQTDEQRALVRGWRRGQ
jgi:protein-tyrosine phosphatase